MWDMFTVSVGSMGLIAGLVVFLIANCNTCKHTFVCKTLHRLLDD